MSNYEWLVGEVVLPTAELATVKREFRSRHNSIIEDAYDKLKRFRNENLTSSDSKWQAAIALTDAPEQLPASTRIAMIVARALERPRAAKWDDFIENNWGKAGVSENNFPLFDNNGKVIGKVVFKGRMMIWVIPEQNYIVDMFDDAEDSKFLYKTLAKVNWVRGSGGGETYNNERLSKPEIRDVFGSRGKSYRAAKSFQ